MTFFDLSSLSPTVFLIVCPLVFLAGLLDAIAGGGGLISMPAYLIAGIPVHTAIATNKLSSSFGAVASAARFISRGMVNFKLGIPAVVFAIIGSSIGARISLRIDDAILTKVLLVVIPITAFIVINRNIFLDKPDNELKFNFKTLIIMILVAFFIGCYDGFFGPGTGTFMIICFTVFGKMNVVNANAQTKLINMTTNLAALTVFLIGGAVMIPLGIAAGICNMLGSWIGAGLAISNGSRIAKPAIIIVLLLLVIKVIGVY